MPNTVVFTPEQESDIEQRYLAGEGCQSIAAAYRCGGGKPIKRILQRRGVFVENRRFTGQFSHADRAEIVRRYNAGDTQSSIADSYGCTHGNIRALLVRQGVYLRPFGKTPVDDRTARVMRELRGQNMSIEEIAKHLGLPKYRVTRWAKDIDLPPYRPGGLPRELWRETNSGRGYRVRYLSADDPMFAMTDKNGCVLTHRLVVARSLGRPLSRWETVHHVDGDRRNNDLSNLQLRRSDHGAGVRFACRDCGSHNVEPIPLT